MMLKQGISRNEDEYYDQNTLNVINVAVEFLVDTIY